MIIAISDVHLGVNYSNKHLFTRFLSDVVSREKVEHFVLAGDVFDMWRRDPLKVVFENIDIFMKLSELHNGTRRVHYVVGNHDYHMICLRNLIRGLFSFDVSVDATLQCGDQNYYFMHGYQLEFADNLDIYQEFADMLCLGSDDIGSTADTFWEVFKIGSSLWKTAKSKLKIDPALLLKWPGERLSEEDVGRIENEAERKKEEFQDQIGTTFIVFGHTHRPYVKEEKRLANTGSWVDDPSRPMLKENTYITIEKSEIPTLREYS